MISSQAFCEEDNNGISLMIDGTQILDLVVYGWSVLESSCWPFFLPRVWPVQVFSWVSRLGEEKLKSRQLN